MDIDELHQAYPDLSGEVDNFFCTLREILPHNIPITMEKGMEMKEIIEQAIVYGYNLKI